MIIEGIDPGPKGRPIEVTMRFNENKTLEVEGKDLLSGQSARTTIKYPGGLTEEELEEATTLVQRTNVSG